MDQDIYQAIYLRVWREFRRNELAMDNDDYHIRLLDIGPEQRFLAVNARDNGIHQNPVIEGSESEVISDTDTDDVDDDIEPDPPLSITEVLGVWGLQENITRKSFDKLLNCLRNQGIRVPLDSRTLLKLPRAVLAIPRCEGQYIYLGVETGVTRLISNFPDSFQEREIKIDLNIDGIPLFSSSSGQMWPILCRVMKF